MSGHTECSKVCYPIGKAKINSTFIVGCRVRKICDGARMTSPPGTYKKYREKFRHHGMITK